MYLKRLEMQGFKSFADKTVLEFMPGITNVIGPNGSGKSNIVDAIKWILGEQSIKTLRGEKSSDIIFAGTQNRRSLGFAEASLIFDNSDGLLPIEYSEVTVTRRIYRTGETGYFINKAACRLKDVLELFMDTGIGKDGYSIIGQGKIDNILSNKSEDRRSVFEEAVGIVKYKARREESEKKLEHTKLNLLRINDILTEIEANLEPLKQQSDKARKYLGLKEELKSIEVGLFVYNIERYKTDLEKISEDMEIMTSNCNLEEGKLEKIKQAKENLKQEIDEITTKIEAMQNIGFESEKKKEKLNSDINIYKANIENNQKNIERFTGEIKELDEKLQSLEDEIKNKLDKKNGLKENREKFDKELKEKQKALDEIMKTFSEKDLHIEESKRTLEENVDAKYQIEGEIKAGKINISNLTSRINQIENEINTNIAEKDKSSFEKEDIYKICLEVESKKKKIESELQNILENKKETDEKIKNYDSQINNLTRELQFKESRHRFLLETEKEKEGYIKSVKALLKECEKSKELGKGMNGAIAELIDVPEKYKTAIEMALGVGIQNIVTENEKDAKRLVKYLRKNNLGRASFLPITSVRGKKLDKIKSKTEVIGIASDLIKYQSKYEGVLLSLLGRTVVVHNMENAILVAKENGYSFRIVTLEGDIINPTGGITGGSIAKRTVNILGRNQEIEVLAKEIEDIKLKIKNLEDEKQKVQKSSNEVYSKKEELEDSIQTIEIKYNVEKQKLETILQNISKIETRIQKLRDEKESICNQRSELEKFLTSNDEKLQELTKTNEELEKVIEEFANANKDTQKQVDDLNFDITNLKISVSSFDESENSINEIADRIRQEIQSYQNSKASKEEQIFELKEKNVQLNNDIEMAQNEIKNIKDEVLNSGTNIEKLKEQRVSSNEKLSQKENEQVEEFKIIEDLKSQIVKIEVKNSKLEEDVTLEINKLWEEYELTPNSAHDYKKPDNVSLTQRRVNNLHTDIRELGSVNVDSIEEYKSLKERYDFTCEQRLDLENTIVKLRDIIKQITETMKKQFKEKFDIINRNFGEVFQELFGGGKAEVTLEDESNLLECGININVQPPGKKLQSMMALSGGERAFTAIALLFAILKMTPAPFCVLDEIEAALDDVNVYRYAEFLKKFSQNTQFLVITHRKGTMEVADTVYGVTMEENGISKLLSMNFKV